MRPPTAAFAPVMTYRPNEPTILTASRMARQLGVDRAWLEDQARAAKIPGVKAGDTYLFDPAETRRAIAGMLRGAKGSVE